MSEDRPHWRKDVTFGENTSLIYVWQGPIVMAALRYTAVSLLPYHGIITVAAHFRTCSQHFEQASVLMLGTGVRA